MTSPTQAQAPSVPMGQNYWNLLPSEVVEKIEGFAKNDNFKLVCRRFFEGQFLQAWAVQRWEEKTRFNPLGQRIAQEARRIAGPQQPKEPQDAYYRRVAENVYTLVEKELKDKISPLMFNTIQEKAEKMSTAIAIPFIGSILKEANNRSASQRAWGPVNHEAFEFIFWDTVSRRLVNEQIVPANFSFPYEVSKIREWVAIEENQQLLGKIKEAYFGYCFEDYSHLPKEIGYLNGVTCLRLFNNKLQDLPEEIGKLSFVEELNLNNNYLSTKDVQDSKIGELRNLKKLELRENSLTSFPSVLLSLTGLEELDVSRQNLRDLPEDLVERLPNLKVLDISVTGLRELPPSLKAKWQKGEIKIAAACMRIAFY